MVGVVVGAGDIGRLAVSPEGDRARVGPWPDVRRACSKSGWGANPSDRRGDRRRPVPAEGVVGESAQRLFVDRVWSHRVLDAQAVDVEQVDAYGGATAVAASAGDERSDEPADALVGRRVVPFRAPVDLQAGALAGVEQAVDPLVLVAGGVALGGQRADDVADQGSLDAEVAGDFFRGQSASAQFAFVA